MSVGFNYVLIAVLLFVSRVQCYSNIACTCSQCSQAANTGERERERERDGGQSNSHDGLLAVVCVCVCVCVCVPLCRWYIQ